MFGSTPKTPEPMCACGVRQRDPYPTHDYMNVHDCKWHSLIGCTPCTQEKTLVWETMQFLVDTAKKNEGGQS